MRNVLSFKLENFINLLWPMWKSWGKSKLYQICNVSVLINHFKEFWAFIYFWTCPSLSVSRRKRRFFNYICSVPQLEKLQNTYFGWPVCFGQLISMCLQIITWEWGKKFPVTETSFADQNTTRRTESRYSIILKYLGKFCNLHFSRWYHSMKFRRRMTCRWYEKMITEYISHLSLSLWFSSSDEFATCN
jgi:hypothetical protein